MVGQQRIEDSMADRELRTPLAAKDDLELWQAMEGDQTGL